MSQIKRGDRAVIISGALGDKGPNVGKEVTVGQFQGEHSIHGRIWKVHGQGLVTEYGAVGDSVDCAAAWLQKLDPALTPGISRDRTVDAN